VTAVHPTGICFFNINNSTGITSATSNLDGALTQATIAASPGTAAVAKCYYKSSASAGSTTITTVTAGTGTDGKAIGFEYSGVGALVTASQTTFSAADPVTATSLVTATAAGQLLVEYITMENNRTIAPNDTSTERSDDGFRVQLQDRLTSGSGVQSPSWDLSATSTGTVHALIFDIPASNVLTLRRRQME
jgi:hypothetical protein